jgi:hypothetical protein
MPKPGRLLQARSREGATILSSSPGLERNGGHATWTGEPGDTMRFQIAFDDPGGASPLAIAGWAVPALLAVGLISFAVLRRRMIRRA